MNKVGTASETAPASNKRKGTTSKKLPPQKSARGRFQRSTRHNMNKK